MNTLNEDIEESYLDDSVNRFFFDIPTNISKYLNRFLGDAKFKDYNESSFIDHALTIHYLIHNEKEFLTKLNENISMYD